MVLKKLIIGLAAAGMVAAGFGAIELRAPANGATVQLVRDNAKAMFAFATREERKAKLRADRAAKSGVCAPGMVWQQAKPVTLEWECTEGEKAPFYIRLAETPDFANARMFIYCGRDGNRFTLEGINGGLKIATTYWWRVETKAGAKSGAGTFTTEDHGPRWIKLQGRIGNIRDVGGWKTADGRRVRQGVLFRGQGLNDNSVDQVTAGPNRLMVTDCDYMTKTLGIKTDLDLRNRTELGDLAASPLGDGVKFVHSAGGHYQGMFVRDWMRAMAVAFRTVNDPANWPLYYHCIGGADRTGVLTYILNGVLGVPEHDLIYDWELTFYPSLPDLYDPVDMNHWQRIQHVQIGLAKYGEAGDSLQRRIELYLLDCGVTMAEIESFRRRMLE